MVELNFEVEAVEPSSFGPLPAGEYDGEIVGCDIKETRSGTNMLSLEIQTDKGKVWDNLNLWHTNPKAVEIAKERLSAIGTALGMTKIDDTDQLLARRVRVRVGIQERNPNYNEVLGYLATSLPSSPAAAVSPAAPAPAPAPASAPWAS